MGQAAGNEMVVKQDFEVVAEVRRFVRLVSGQWGMDDFAPCLVASELVTNALRYASEEDGDVTLRLGRTEDDALWMEVQDGTCRTRHPSPHRRRSRRIGRPRADPKDKTEYAGLLKAQGEFLGVLAAKTGIPRTANDQQPEDTPPRRPTGGPPPDSPAPFR